MSLSAHFMTDDLILNVNRVVHAIIAPFCQLYVLAPKASHLNSQWQSHSTPVYYPK